MQERLSQHVAHRKSRHQPQPGTAKFQHGIHITLVAVSPAVLHTLAWGDTVIEDAARPVRQPG